MSSTLLQSERLRSSNWRGGGGQSCTTSKTRLSSIYSTVSDKMQPVPNNGEPTVYKRKKGAPA